MAITFVKDTNGKVIVDNDGKKYSLDASMNVIPHPDDTHLIIITDSSAPLEAREVLKFGWAQVTVPANTSRNDLIEKLGKNFFYNALSVAFPAGLATEAKQDAQITLETAIRDYLDTVETKLASIITNTTGLNLEATQLLIKAKTDNLDVLLSSRASNAVLLQVKAGTDNIPAVSQAIMDESMPVVIASDQSTIQVVTDTASTQSTTTVAASVTSVTLKASNTDRRQITITNTSTKKLWICFFTPATSATPFFLSKDETWIFDNYVGAIYGIWDTGATGDAYITEESV